MQKLIALQLFIIKVIILLGLQSSDAVADELLELRCSTDQHCQHFENGKCINDHCRCFVPALREYHHCRPKELRINNIVGGPCPCSFKHGECNEHEDICYCAKGYVPSNDKRRCLKAQQPLGAACELDAQCYGSNVFAKCEQQMCRCKHEFQEVNGTCLALLDEHHNCSNSSNCKQAFADQSLCLSEIHRCACAEQSVAAASKSQCLPAANYNESCSKQSQCELTLGKGARCINDSKCGCDMHHVLRLLDETQNRWHCEPIARFGQYCYDSQDCYQYQYAKDQQSMECIRSECRCKENYYLKDHWYCTNGSSSALNASLGGFVTLLATIVISYLFSSL